MVIMIILLILRLPLILMLSLFTTTEVVSMVVDVPVNGIDVAIEELIELDLDKGESFVVDYVVSPTEAANKSVSFYFSSIGDAKLASFTVDGNKITPISYGSARVTVETVDGGYRDSFDVVVYSKRVQSITSSVESSLLTVGETVKISTSYYPAVVKDEGLSYRVKDGEGVVSVSQSGTIRAVGIGTATVEVISNDNPEARSEITVTVQSSGIVDFVSDRCDITALDNIAYISAVINPDVTLTDYAVELFYKDSGEPLPAGIATATLDTATGLVCCLFTDDAFVGDIEIRLTLSTDSDSVTKSCYVHRISEISIGWADAGVGNTYEILYSNSEGERIGIDLRPIGADVSYFLTLDFAYNKEIAQAGGVSSGVAFELVEGNVYLADGGFVSVQLESFPDGVFLVIKGRCEPSMSDLVEERTLTRVSLTVRNNHDGSLTVLDGITVVIY